jgi:hypothetical protein
MDVIIFSITKKPSALCSTERGGKKSMANTNHVERVWCYPETMIHLYILGMKENRGAREEKEAGFQEQDKDKRDQGNRERTNRSYKETQSRNPT